MDHKQTMEAQAMAAEKVLASFEIDPQQLKKLKALAQQHERSYSFILRKLADQAIEAGTYELVPKVALGIKRGSKV